ncbi:MAG: hypothetical protein R3Y46_01625 [Opitutales bacterium]
MSNQYTLEINSTIKTLDAWNITSAVLTLNNQASDEFVFTCNEDISINSKIDLYRDETRVFTGIIYKAPEDASAQNTKTSYQALGSWYELEEIVYQQKWTHADSNSSEFIALNTYKSHVVLGQGYDGNLIDIATEFEHILAYAQESSADIDIGIMGVNSPMLYDETTDISCATAIKRILKWVPDAITYFDYSQETPTINVKRRADLEEKDLDLNIDNLKSYNISPRDDLSINGVEIKYEKTHTIDDYTWNTLEIDKYPTDLNSQSKKSLVITVELDGYSATKEEREIVCEELDTSSVTWWQSKVPFLKNATNIEILEVNRNHPTYFYELISGSVPEWAISNTDTGTEELEAFFRYDSNGQTYEKRAITHKFTAINRNSHTFTRTVVSDYEEPRPIGLAQSLYEALNPLKYDATITLYNAHANDFVGKKLNLLNAKSEYASMQTPIMKLSQNLFNDTLSIKAGTPSQLYPSNIAEIFRLNKYRQSTSSTTSKTTGTTSTSSTIRINDTYSQENTTTEDICISRISLGDEEKTDKVEIDSAKVPYNLKMEIKQVVVAKNGEKAYSYMLMTEPKTQAELDELEAQEQASQSTESSETTAESSTESNN